MSAQPKLEQVEALNPGWIGFGGLDPKPWAVSGSGPRLWAGLVSR
jgi:hypothetical protein